MSKKYDQYEEFLRDVNLHGLTLPVGEAHIPAMAKAMKLQMVIGTQSMLDYVRAEIAKRPEIGTQQPAPAPKKSLAELRKLTASQKLDVSNDVPAPTLNGLKKPHE